MPGTSPRFLFSFRAACPIHGSYWPEPSAPNRGRASHWRASLGREPTIGDRTGAGIAQTSRSPLCMNRSSSPHQQRPRVLRVNRPCAPTQAMQASGARSKREAVELGLLTLVGWHQQGEIRSFRFLSRCLVLNRGQQHPAQGQPIGRATGAVPLGAGPGARRSLGGGRAWLPPAAEAGTGPWRRPAAARQGAAPPGP